MQPSATGLNNPMARNVDPHMTVGQLVGRLVNEGLGRHDPGRPPRRGRTRSAPAGADRPPAAKRKVDSDGAAASAPKRSAAHTDALTSAAKSCPRAGRAISAEVKREIWQRGRRTLPLRRSTHRAQMRLTASAADRSRAPVRPGRPCAAGETSDCCASRITATAIRSGLHGEGRPRDRHGRAAEHRQPSIAARNPEDPAKVPKRTQAPYQDRARRGGPPSTFANTSQYDQERSYT